MRIAEAVRNYIDEKEINQSHLARDLGVPVPYVSSLANGKPFQGTIDKLEFMLDYMEIDYKRSELELLKERGTIEEPKVPQKVERDDKLANYIEELESELSYYKKIVNNLKQGSDDYVKGFLEALRLES